MRLLLFTNCHNNISVFLKHLRKLWHNRIHRGGGVLAKQIKRNVLTEPFNDVFNLMLAHFSRVFKRLQHRKHCSFSVNYDELNFTQR